MQKNAAGTMIASNTYSLDQVGNRLGNTTADTSIAYQYDPVYRLTQALYSTPGYSSNSTGKGKGIANATQQQKEFYTYDPVGNRLSSDRIKNYIYNPGNQLALDGGNYTYDKNGNLVEKVTADGTTTYAWDYDNRLLKVVAPDGTVTEFAYDPFGRRIVKNVTENGASTATNYFYDNSGILFEYDDAGTIGNRYTDGTVTDEHLKVDTSKGKYYYHADGLGSIIAVTDTAGTVVQTYQYDSFGDLKDQKYRVKQPYTYTGREWDRETGLYYYRARYYDPMEGRFIAKDPFGFNGGINLYNYVESNPVNKVDPFGLKPPAMDPGPSGDGFTTPASYTWDPNDNGSFTNAYCSVISKAISICLDKASIDAALTKSLPGFAIYGLAITNSAVNFTICPAGVSPSTVTTVLWEPFGVRFDIWTFSRSSCRGSSVRVDFLKNLEVLQEEGRRNVRMSNLTPLLPPGLERLLFGISGLPLGNGRKFNYASAIPYLKEFGLEAMELLFVRSINVSDKNKDAILRNKLEHDFYLSAHGSYYINLNADTEEMQQASVGRIIAGVEALSKVQGRSLIFHPGYYLGSSNEAAYLSVRENLSRLPHQGIDYRLETTGKGTQFGTMEELVSLCKEIGSCKLCIDFAHVHARNNGSLKHYEDFAGILQYVLDELGHAALDDLHIHMGGVEYGVKGERNHLPLQESDFNFVACLEALRDFDVKGCVICEGPRVEHDALLLKRTYEGL